MRPLFASLVLAAAGLAACTPALSTPLDQIPKLTKLDDVMANQATIADPQFAKIGQTTYADADYAAFTAVAERLQITSQKTEDFAGEFAKGKETEFKDVAKKLGEKAKALGTAAAAKDAPASSAALKDLKSTCKECHSKFR